MAKCVCVMPSKAASRFIMATKAGTEPPTCSAMAMAASFPEGSIKP